MGWKESLPTQRMDTNQRITDWKIFTKERLENLKSNKESYIKSHGIKGYEIIEDFYITAFSSFDKEIIGGIRLVCEK